MTQSCVTGLAFIAYLKSRSSLLCSQMLTLAPRLAAACSVHLRPREPAIWREAGCPEARGLGDMRQQEEETEICYCNVCKM